MYANDIPPFSNDFIYNSVFDPLVQADVMFIDFVEQSTSTTQQDILMNRHLHAELKHIDDLINDVEMQVHRIEILLASLQS